MFKKLRDFIASLKQKELGTPGQWLCFIVLLTGYYLDSLSIALGFYGVLGEGILKGIGWMCVAYLVGSIPFSIIIPRMFGKVDPRTVGSKNPGTTNVYRASGLRCAICVAVGDVLKGMIPVYLALYLIKDVGIEDLGNTAPIFIGFGCIIGHLWSIFLSGKGGKGVATSAGVLFPLMPWVIVTAAIMWILVTKCTRYAVLATGVSVLIAVIGSVFAHTYPACLLFPFVCILGLLIILKHRENVARFCQGREQKVTKISP